MNVRNIFASLTCILIVSLGFVIAIPTESFAQGANKQGANTIDEIVITARRREETTFDVPGSVTVFDRVALDAIEADSIGDIEHSIPNFLFFSPRPFDATVTMRGLGEGTQAPGVGLYIDGAYQVGSAGFTLPMFDLERVEVLKGPQGTLYGRNSFAGAINYITRPPSDKFEADALAEMGNAQTLRASISVAGPLVSDILSGRLTFGIQRRDGFREFMDGSPADKEDYNGATARLVLRPTKSLTADLKLSHVETDGGAYLYHQASGVNDKNGVLAQTAPFSVGPLAGNYSSSQLDHDSVNFRLGVEGERIAFRSITTYDDLKNLSYYDVDLGPPDTVNVLTEFWRDAFSQEFRLQSQKGDRLSWLLGVYYTEGEDPACCGNVLAGSQFAGSPGGALNPFRPIGKYEGLAGFVDVELALTDRWTIGGGIRYDTFDKSVIDAADMVIVGDTFSATQPKLSVKYLMSDSSQIYLTVAEGFREGGFNTLAVGTPLQSYPNDELISYEAGLKSRFADGRGSADLAVFYIDTSSYSGSALLETPSGPRNLSVPIGAIESYGVEAEISYRLMTNTLLDFAGGYNSAEPTELLPTVQNGIAYVGEQVLYAPRWNFQLRGEQLIELGNDIDLRFSASVSGVGPTNFRGEGNIVQAPLRERDPYYLIDVFAKFEFSDRYSATIFAKNLANEIYVEELSPLSTVSAFGGTLPGVVYNEPRYYGVSFRAAF